MATDTDITALIERLRKVKAETARDAADALEALLSKLVDMTIFYGAMKIRAEKAEAELKRMAETSHD
jgi:predicted nucleic acid-binding protein